MNERTGFVNPDTGNEADLSIVERAGVAFDPTSQHLDLSKEEKRRTTAIMLAIQAYRELIIKEADYLDKMADLARRGEIKAEDGGEFKLRPATVDAMVVAAWKFDNFIAGKHEAPADEGRVQTEAETEAGDGSADA